jgi:protein RecA
MSDAVQEFLDRVNKTYGGTVVRTGTQSIEALQIRRFSTGVLSADCALGGGWPFGRICLIAGEYSSGKTLLALKAAERVTECDSATHLHRSRVDPDKFSPCRALFVDAEGSYDLDWAIANGWNSDLHCVAQPEYAEQTIDIVSDAIRENVFDLIILDSIAALTPTKEISESSEDWQMGLGARLCNKAMRKWTANLAKTGQQSDVGGPCVIALNQFRLKIGLMFGDPRTLPNGKGQEFAASIIMYMKSSKVVDDEKEEHGFGEYGGYTLKNKTFVPKCNFKFRMALKDHPDWKKGQIDNVKQLMALCRKYGLVTKDSTKWQCNGQQYKTLTEIKEKLALDEAFYLLMWRSVVKAFGGAVV